MNKKRFLSLMLAMLMIVTSIPMFLISALASSNPVAKGTLVTAPRYEDYITDAAPDETGWRSNPRQYRFTDIVDLTSDGSCGVDANTQAYCINYGGKFRGEDLTQYVGCRPEDSDYFNSLNETEQMGMLLIAAFGFPAIEFAFLGADSVGDAVAATQALIWEFDLGSRTSFTGDANNGWAYAMVKNDEGARRAYWNILSSAQAWIDAGGNWKELLADKGMIVWENGDTAQVMLTYSEERPIDPFGYMYAKKEDIDGNPVAGAVFTVYDSTGKEFGMIGPTDANGWAQYYGDDGKPEIPYGKYRVIETVFPENYTAVGATSWTVEVNENNPHITVNATNRPLKYVEIEKTHVGDIDYSSNMTFAIYDDATGERLLTLTTDENGNTPLTLIPQTESGRYRWEEITKGAFTCQALIDGEWGDGRRRNAAFFIL